MPNDSNFTQTRNDIINGALRLCRVLSEGQTATAQQVSDAAISLNRMVKAWQADGLQLWAKQEATLFLTANTAQYLLGTTGANFTTSYTDTTLSANAAAGAGTVTVTSATGISSGQFIGVWTDSNTIHWTTVSGAPGTASF